MEIKVTLREWGKANALFSHIFEWISKNGGEIAGPPFFQYIVKGNLDKEFQIKAGVITTNLMKGDGKVTPSHVPGEKLYEIDQLL